MDYITLSIFTVANLCFLAAGYRMGKGQTPVANPWPSLTRFVNGKQDAPKEPKAIPQEKF